MPVQSPVDPRPVQSSFNYDEESVIAEFLSVDEKRNTAATQGDVAGGGSSCGDVAGGAGPPGPMPVLQRLELCVTCLFGARGQFMALEKATASQRQEISSLRSCLFEFLQQQQRIVDHLGIDPTQAADNMRSLGARPTVPSNSATEAEAVKKSCENDELEGKLQDQDASPSIKALQQKMKQHNVARPPEIAAILGRQKRMEEAVNEVLAEQRQITTFLKEGAPSFEKLRNQFQSAPALSSQSSQLLSDGKSQTEVKVASPQINPPPQSVSHAMRTAPASQIDPEDSGLDSADDTTASTSRKMRKLHTRGRPVVEASYSREPDATIGGAADLVQTPATSKAAARNNFAGNILLSSDLVPGMLSQDKDQDRVLVLQSSRCLSDATEDTFYNDKSAPALPPAVVPSTPSQPSTPPSVMVTSATQPQSSKHEYHHQESLESNSSSSSPSQRVKSAAPEEPKHSSKSCHSPKFAKSSTAPVASSPKALKTKKTARVGFAEGDEVSDIGVNEGDSPKGNILIPSTDEAANHTCSTYSQQSSMTSNMDGNSPTNTMSPAACLRPGFATHVDRSSCISFTSENRQASEIFDVNEGKTIATNEDGGKLEHSNSAVRWSFAKSLLKQVPNDYERFTRATTFVLKALDEERSGKGFRGKVAKTVRHAHFQLFIGMMIALNSILIGVRTEWIMQNTAVGGDGIREPREFHYLEIMFTGVFTVELALRLYVESSMYFCNDRWKWNWFDAIVVCVSITELVAVSFVGENNRALQTLRLVRLVRLVRFLRFLSGLQRIVVMITGTLRSLLWAMMLLLMVAYLLGVYLLQVVIDAKRHYSERQETLILIDHFASIQRTFYTLFKAISGGMDWGDVVDNLWELNVLACTLFCVYIAFAVFCILNVVTGAFVNVEESVEMDANGVEPKISSSGAVVVPKGSRRRSVSRNPEASTTLTEETHPSTESSKPKFKRNDTGGLVRGPLKPADTGALGVRDEDVRRGGFAFNNQSTSS